MAGLEVAPASTRNSRLVRGAKKVGTVLAILLFISSSWSVIHAMPESESITGAGATFPYPLYAKWASSYKQLRDVDMVYQPIGSGGGIAQIKAKVVDFGASDEPLSAEALTEEGLIQFPLIMGGVVPVVNVGGIGKGELKLTPELLADIFLGIIKKWNDRRLMAVNHHLALPDERINVVHRADGSGTTWIFTRYLSKTSRQWKRKVGWGKSVAWPTGLGAKGNPGLAARVKQVKGSIGYVEFAYAVKHDLSYVTLQNRSGRYVGPSVTTFQAAAQTAHWTNGAGFSVDLTDQEGQDTWPITGASYVLIHKNQMDRHRAETMLKFFDWCLKKGGKPAIELHYVPIPESVVTLVNSLWKREVTCDGSPVWE